MNCLFLFSMCIAMVLYRGGNYAMFMAYFSMDQHDHMPQLRGRNVQLLQNYAVPKQKQLDKYTQKTA